MSVNKNRTSILPKLAIIFVGLALLSLNWRQFEKQNTQQDEMLDLTNSDIPPSLAVTTQALGPIRTMVSNSLWWRAIELQDEKNYYEAIQMANWISLMQPKLAGVWNYQAWNMAWNLSATSATKKDKWKWIYNGIKLQRDKGLRYNPRNPDISLELGRIFLEKMADDVDASANYYKLRWALIMQDFFPTGERKDIIELVNAARSLEELNTIEGVPVILAAAKEKGVDLLSWNFHKAEKRSELEQAFWGEWQSKQGFSDIKSFVTVKTLKDIHKLDIDKVNEIDEIYGPLDWRLPQAHCIFYVARENRRDQYGWENYESPYLRQAMALAFYNGKIVELTNDSIALGPNLNMINSTHNYLLKLEQDRYFRVSKFSKIFHERAVIILYSNMYLEDAKKMFEHYKEDVLEKRGVTNYTFEEFMNEAIPRYVTQKSANNTRSVILSTISQSIYWGSMGDLRKAQGYDNMARLVWTDYQKKFGKNEAKRLPPFNQMRMTVLKLMSADSYKGSQRIKDFAQKEQDGEKLEQVEDSSLLSGPVKLSEQPKTEVPKELKTEE
ncbi:MAG: hypothetical protein MK193_09425 [Lentisphaeria bacterium]|nr:hypothetical protein [Lentisphaeria bacterium]